jgi:UPF0271 protein
VRDANEEMILVGLAGSELIRAAQTIGVRVAHEAFADRRYEGDGSLTPRREADAVIHDVDDAVAQAVHIAKNGKVDSRAGAIGIRADTICVHGDRENAGVFAQKLRETLEGAGIVVKAL